MDILLLILLLVGGVVMIVLGLRRSQEPDTLEERLAQFGTLERPPTLEEIEMSQPFTERVVYPLARKFGEIATRFTQQNALQETARKLEQAGSPRGIDPTIFWAGRFVVAVILMWGAKNLTRSKIGRAFIAIRDNDISAEIIGISIFRYKLLSFAVSAFYAGVAGALYASFLRTALPEDYHLLHSIQSINATHDVLGGIIEPGEETVDIYSLQRKLIRIG